MTKKLFTFKDAWIWTVLFAAALGAILVAGFSHDLVGGLIVGGTALSIEIFTTYRYILRYEWNKAWNSAPKIGESLWPMAVFCDGADIGEEEYYMITDTVNTLMDNWYDYIDQKYPDHNIQLNNPEKYLSGGSLHIVKEPFTLAGTKLLLAGVALGNILQVVGPPAASLERFWALIRHEFSHAILTSWGFPAGANGELHHKMFEESGLGN